MELREVLNRKTNINKRESKLDKMVKTSSGNITRQEQKFLEDN